MNEKVHGIKKRYTVDVEKHESQLYVATIDISFRGKVIHEDEVIDSQLYEQILSEKVVDAIFLEPYNFV